MMVVRCGDDDGAWRDDGDALRWGWCVAVMVRGVMMVRCGGGGALR